MASAATARGVLCRLRRDIARIEGRLAEADRLAFASEDRGGSENPGVSEGSGTAAGQADGPMPSAAGLAARFFLGLPALDTVLGGGLARAALHEIRAAQSRDEPAASGFALALVARSFAQKDAATGDTMKKPPGRPLDWAPDILWISEAGSRREAGALYAPGLVALGLDPGRIVQVAARRPDEALWAFEAGLSCAGLAAVICQLRQPHERGPGKAFDLAATRRLALKARESGVCGLLVRLAAPPEPSAAQTRWRVVAASSGPAGLLPGGFSPAASAARPGACDLKRTAAGAPAPSRWSGMLMSTVSKSRAVAPGAKAPQRILALWLPYLATDRLQRDARGLIWRAGRRPGDPPIAIVGKINNALRLAAIDEAAAARGLRVGQALADARGAVPGLVVHEEDANADAALLEAIAGWCERYTPLVALDPPDGLYLDITGCAHLFAPAPLFTPDEKHDGEAPLAADLGARLGAQGFAVKTAIASSPGAAWALARHGEARHGQTQRIAPGAERQALAGLPVAALRLEAGPRALLDRLGLKRIGQLIGQPRAPLAARFGSALLTRLDQVLGHVDEPLSPRLPAPALTAERRFAEPVADMDSIGATVRSLAAALQPALTRRGEGARALQLVLFASDGAVTRLSVGTAAPVRDAGLIAALFAERLAATGADETDFGAGYGDAAGFDMVRLCVTRSELFAEVQVDLAGEAGDAADLNQLFSRLGARLGEASVTRPVAIDSHIPEQAVLARPVASQNARSGAAAAGSGPEKPYPGYPPERPLKLFERPEPVEVVAEVPEGPPLAFRWRRVLYQVVRAEGPERIAPEWWRGDMAVQNLATSTRDYFRIEDREGRRFWLYRDGLYGGEAHHAAGRPSWYVHGLFA